jgi:hypothetical protein
MPLGDELIRWTVRLALFGFTIALLLRASRRGIGPAARLFWTIGCLAYLGHVAAAFHFAHGWSHARAHEHTAFRTWEVTGWRWGGGIYVNYLFTLVWVADAAWWWISVGAYQRRPAWVDAALYAFMLFVAFNATVVFGAGVIRWCGLAAVLLLGAAWWRRRAARLLERETLDGP